MAVKHSQYFMSPGKQQDPLIVPRSWQPVFFEGVQSIDASSNTTDMQHGQHGSLSNVIEEKNFDNMSGTVNLKNLGHMWPNLRALCDQDPDGTNSMLFDPAYLATVDVFVNIFTKMRDRVMYSRWYADFNAAFSSSDPLDDVNTVDLEYTATRLLIFDGYQITIDTFPDTVAGDKTFTLQQPAIVPPVMHNVKVRAADGVVSGKQLHEYCPIEYALRVWVGDQVLTESDQATIHTQNVGTPTDPILQSKLELKEPVQADNTMVKVMYLIPGDAAIAVGSVTKAPVMVESQPQLDLITTPGTPIWEEVINVSLSKTLSPASKAALAPAEFKLIWYVGTTKYEMEAVTLDPNISVTDNWVALNFVGGTVMETLPGGSPTPAAGVIWPAATPAEIEYDGTTMYNEDPNITLSPKHSIAVLPY